MWILLGWFCSLLLVILLMAMIGFQQICLRDLGADYLNSVDAVSSLNKFVFPELYLQGALCISFLLTGQWFVCFLALPIFYYNVRLYIQKRHLLYATDIFSQLEWEKHKRLYKTIYLAILIIVSTVWMVWQVPELLED